LEKAKIKVLSHTWPYQESSCVLLYNEEGKPEASSLGGYLIYRRCGDLDFGPRRVIAN